MRLYKLANSPYWHFDAWVLGHGRVRRSTAVLATRAKRQEAIEAGLQQLSHYKQYPRLRSAAPNLLRACLNAVETLSERDDAASKRVVRECEAALAMAEAKTDTNGT